MSPTPMSSEIPLSSISSQGRRGGGAIADRQALLSTIESHVLLPLCTGASVTTIVKLLDACTQESCERCMGECTSREISGGGGVLNCEFHVLPA